MVVLPAPFGPDQPEDLALLDVEVDAGDGERPVVALDEALGPDDRAHRTFPVIDRSTLNPTPSVLVVDEPDQDRARCRIDVAAGLVDGVARARR